MVRALRTALFTCAFVAGASTVGFRAAEAVLAVGVPRVGLALDLNVVAHEVARVIRKDRGPQRIALIGDSNMMAAEGMSSRRQTLPGRIRQALRQYDGGERATLHTLCVPGLGPSAFYFVTDAVIAARPERVVVALNLRAFNSIAMRRFGYSEAAGFMSASQLATALWLPVFDFGLTADRLLFYGAVDAFGATGALAEAQQLQARFFNLRSPIAEWMDARAGSHAHAEMQFAVGIAHLARAQAAGRNRESRDMAERNLGPLLHGLSPSHPGLQLLRTALARYRRASIPVVVYIEPVNVAHLRTLGLDLEPLRASIRTIAGAVEREGAQLSDFHDLFPDAAFRDAGDHYTFEGSPNGTTWLGDRIAYAIVTSAPAAFAATTNHAVQ